MAAIEQRIDLQSPIDRLLARIADSFKGAVPAEATVKIHLEPTPLQEVEASLGRNKDASSSGSLAAKVAGEEGVDASKKNSSAAAEVEKVFNRIETMATRIGYLMQKIESGKDVTGNAATELERLRNSLEKVAEKGKDAAHSLGDAGLADKVERAAEAAGEGHGGKAGKASVGDLQQMMNDPVGALKNKMMQRFAAPIAELLGSNIGTLFSGGAGAGMLAGGLAASAGALATGGMIGWKMNTGWAGKAAGDAQAALRDDRISNSIGSNFDLRGLTFNASRSGANLDTKDGQSLNSAEVRDVLQGMGIGVDNLKNADGGHEVINTAMRISRNAQGIGVGTDQLASIVGAAVKSGAVAQDVNKMNAYLSEIAGATKEAAKHGVTSAEKLQVIASLNQKTVAETGLLTSSGSRMNMQASAALEATGQAGLKGGMGATMLGQMAGSGDDTSRAREIGELMGEDGDLKPEYKRMVMDDPALAKLYAELGPVMAANALLDNGSLRAGVNQRMVRNMVKGGMSSLQASRIVGVKTGSLSKDARTAAGFLDANDIQSQTLTPEGDAFNKGNVNAVRNLERSDAQSLVSSAQQGEENRKTGMTYAAADSIMRTNHEVSVAMTKLTNWLSEHVNVRGG
jgi:hypothetical protein